LITRFVAFDVVGCGGEKYFATIASTADKDLLRSKI
jgi:hypothetical protein